MRYKEDDIPPELFTANSSNEMLLFTAIMGLVIGVVMFYLGRTGKQLWIWTWGIGLIICSIFLGFAIRSDFHPGNFLSSLGI